MVFKLFKDGNTLYDEGKEFIKRGEFRKARDYLVKSIEKEGGIDDKAAVKVALIDLSDSLTNPNDYDNVVRTVDALESPGTIEFGIDLIDSQELRTECALTSRKLKALAMGGSRHDLMQKAQTLQQIAQDFQTQIGERSLIVLGLFRKDTSVTGNTEFYNLMAISYETMADGTVFDNPSQAAEYQQIAAGYRQQNGQSTEENMRKVREYSTTCTCWVCGRIATGEGIHFFSAPADVSPSLKDEASAAAKSRADTEHIYICRACYTAVSNRADAIAQEYHQEAMRQMYAMEARLQAEIASLQAQIAFARH